MRVTEEIDALETMAISPIHFLVTPKFMAMIVMLPCLTIWANTMGDSRRRPVWSHPGRLYVYAIHSDIDRVSLSARTLLRD